MGEEKLLAVRNSAAAAAAAVAVKPLLWDRRETLTCLYILQEHMCTNRYVQKCTIHAIHAYIQALYKDTAPSIIAFVTTVFDQCNTAPLLF